VTVFIFVRFLKKQQILKHLNNDSWNMVHPQRRCERLSNEGRDYVEKQGNGKKFPLSKVPIGADNIEAAGLVKEVPVGLSAEDRVVNFLPLSFPACSPPQLLDMFGSLLERPLIAVDAADKYPVLISMFNSALDHARLIYSRHIQAELELGG